MVSGRWLLAYLYLACSRRKESLGRRGNTEAHVGAILARLAEDLVDGRLGGAKRILDLGAPEPKRLGDLGDHILGCATLTLHLYAPFKS